MRTSLAGRALLGLGVAVGIAATGAWFLGFDPTTLPPALLKIAAYKLTAIAAFGLIAAGAVVLRYSRHAEQHALEPLSSHDPTALNAGDVASIQERGVRDELRNAKDSVRERRE